MWNSMFLVAVATAGFAVIHSALASRMVKRTVAKIIGERNRNGLYRVFFITQSLVTFGFLAAYILSLPSQVVYRIESPLVWLMYVLQVGAVVYTIAAARQVGIMRIVGLASFAKWFGSGPVSPEPEAQGPALDATGLVRKSGPFAWSRHPLNIAPLVILCLWPTMTTTLLAFNTIATIYFIFGSLHEEARLRTAYGEAYSAYQRSGVPFYFPWPTRSPLQPMQAISKSDESTR
jgi:methanethiol S-methyltransferase